MDLKETGCQGVDRTYLAQDRDQQGSCEYGNKSSGSIKGRECLII
jgi:hypothetical protein